MEVGRNQREIAVPRLIITVTSDLERNLISKHYVNDGKIYELCFIDRKIEAQSTVQVGGSHCSRALIHLVPEFCWDLNSSLRHHHTYIVTFFPKCAFMFPKSSLSLQVQYYIKNPFTSFSTPPSPHQSKNS